MPPPTPSSAAEDITPPPIPPPVPAACAASAPPWWSGTPGGPAPWPRHPRPSPRCPHSPTPTRRRAAGTWGRPPPGHPTTNFSPGLPRRHQQASRPHNWLIIVLGCSPPHQNRRKDPPGGGPQPGKEVLAGKKKCWLAGPLGVGSCLAKTTLAAKEATHLSRSGF